MAGFDVVGTFDEAQDDAKIVGTFNEGDAEGGPVWGQRPYGV